MNDSSRSRRKPPFWKGVNSLLWWGIFLIVGVLLYFLFQPQLLQLGEMENNLESIEQQKQQAKLEQVRLAREKELIKTDPTYVENIARDKLDLMKPGETIFRLENRQSSSEAPKKP